MRHAGTRGGPQRQVGQPARGPVLRVDGCRASKPFGWLAGGWSRRTAGMPGPARTDGAPEDCPPPQPPLQPPQHPPEVQQRLQAARPLQHALARAAGAATQDVQRVANHHWRPAHHVRRCSVWGAGRDQVRWRGVGASRSRQQRRRGSMQLASRLPRQTPGGQGIPQERVRLPPHPPGPASSRIVSPGRLAATASARLPNWLRYQWGESSTAMPLPPAVPPAASATPDAVRAGGGCCGRSARRAGGLARPPAPRAAWVTYSQLRRSSARSRKRCRWR